MSASRNADASSNQPGEIGSHIARDEPLTTHGVRPCPYFHPVFLLCSYIFFSSLIYILLTQPQHKPGVLVGNDAAPEFHAKTLPPGTAPKSNTFTPNSTSETPGQADNDNVLRSHGKESTQTTASSTLGGATSADVHTGYGHPGQGQTSNELRHDNRGGGLAGVGASGASAGNMGVDERLQGGQRGLEKEGGNVSGGKGGTGQEKGTAAEDRLPQGL